MPIRMTDDPQDQNEQNYDDGGGGNRPNFPGGGGGGLMSLLPMLLGLFKGKGIFVLLIIGAAAYFLLGRGGCNLSKAAETLMTQSGYRFNSGEYNKSKVYEGLAEDAGRNPLPEAVTLLKFAPERLNQGQQGSCVAWSCAYAAQTILTSAATGNDPNAIRFSPSYLYNQIKLEGCQGSYLQRAMEAMAANGGVPLSSYPYNEEDCDRMPNENAKQVGRQNVIHGYQRLTDGDNINQGSVSVRAVKEHLAKDAPVAIGMMVGQSFMQGMMGQELWEPASMDASQMGMGGHAMCVVGYDDRKFGGAFQIMNSWGPEWGKNGVAWVRYGDFKEYVREAYGIDPLPKQSAVANIPLECTIGMIDNNTNKNIPLKVTTANVFQTISPIKKGTRFKMAVRNATECYVYVFGMDTTSGSYVLFPYLKQGETVSKHSPYFGITGYRLFPKGSSYEADAVGNKDYIAIVTSKVALDANALNAVINRSQRSDYAGKVNEALQSIAVRSVKYTNTGDGSIYFKADANDNKAIACIVTFDKQ
jgi:hypothetical protein